MKISKLILSSLTLIMLLSFSSTSFAYLEMKVKSNNSNQLDFTGQEGSKKKEIITLTNTDKKEGLSLNLEFIDSKIDSQGAISYKTGKDPQEAVGKWLTVSEKKIYLKPLESKDVEVMINIDNNNSPGTYLGGFSIFKDKEAESNQEKTAFMVSVKTRTVERVVLTIPGEIIKKYSLDKFQISENGKGEKEANFDISNSGNVLIKYTGSIDIIQDGKVVKTVLLNDGLINRYSKVNFNKSLELNSYGNFKAVAKIKIFSYKNNQQDFVMEEVIELSDDFSYLPWNYIFMGALLLLLLIGTIIWSLIYKNNYIKKCQEYIVKENDTLTSIATKIRWIGRNLPE